MTEDPTSIYNRAVATMNSATTPAERREAVLLYDQVVRHPDCPPDRKADALNNIGLTAQMNHEDANAEMFFTFALKCQPTHGPALINRGDVCYNRADWQGAQRDYHAALNHNPDMPEAHFSAGMLALLLGDFTWGWHECRWRFDTANFSSRIMDTDKPLWNGDAP